MSWSKDYKKSIDCDNPKGFSQRAHCAARKKRQRGEETKSESPFSEGTLHHWFRGSKSKDGKPGWVQADGSPCANEPGETKTPKCFSSGRLRSLKKKGKKGETLIRSAVRRKRQKDKGQQEKSGAAAPTNVATFAKGKKDPNYIKAEPGIKEAMEINEAKKDKPGKGSGTKDACYHKVKSRYDVWPSAYASGALVKCRKVGADNWGTKTEESSLNYDWDTPIRERPDRYCPKCEKLETRQECKYGPKYWDMFSLPAELISNKKDYNITMPYPGPDALSSSSGPSINQMKYNSTRPHPANEAKEYKDQEHSMSRSELSTAIDAIRRLQKRMKGEGNIEAWVQSKITKAADYLDTAADYLDSGESKVEESIIVQDSEGNNYVEFIDIVKPEPLQPSKGLGSKISFKEESYSDWRSELLQEKPGDGYIGNTLIPNPIRLAQDAVDAYNRSQQKTVNRVNQEIPGSASMSASYFNNGPSDASKKYLGLKNSYEPKGEQLDEKCWKGYEKKGMQTMFGKRYPNCVKAEEFSDWRTDLGEDWQKVNRQDKTDGLSQAAVDAYRRENPGSKLQTAVTEKKPKGKRAKRRANFCRRMKGMKSKLTSAKTARDPDSRINKALRRWNCH